MFVGLRPTSARSCNAQHKCSSVHSSCRTLITNLHTMHLAAPFHSAPLPELAQGARVATWQTWGTVMDAEGLMEAKAMPKQCLVCVPSH